MFIDLRRPVSEIARSARVAGQRLAIYKHYGPTDRWPVRTVAYHHQQYGPLPSTVNPKPGGQSP